MARAKAKPFIAAPGGSDMRLDEAFKTVLDLAERQLRRTVAPEREIEAIKPIRALWVGSYGGNCARNVQEGAV